MTLFENLYESLRSLLGGGNHNLSLEEKRQAYRIGCHINVSIKSEGGLFTALCTDIGTTGMRIECSEREKLKKLSKMVINMADRKTGALGPAIPGQVVWRRRIGDTGRVYVGVCFECRRDALKSTWVGPYLDKLGYHEKAKAAERRRHVRLGSGLPVEVRRADGAHVGGGKLVDLSGGGSKAQISGFCSIGSDVVLKIGPLESLAPIEVPASVVNCREEGEETFVVRVRFAGLDPVVHKSLKKYLTTLQKRNSTI